MQTLITGDLHLTARPEEDYRWAVFPYLKRQAEKHGARQLILLGDVTDRKDHHPARLVNRLMEELLALDLNEIFWVAGNHDFADPAQPFFKWIGMVPGLWFFHEPALVTCGGMDALFLPSTANPLEEWKDLNWDAADATFMHQPSLGAALSNGSKIGNDDPAAAGLISFLRARTKKPIFSGDIHTPQQCGPIIYLGSPHPVHFGDSFSPRIGLLSVTSSDMAFKSIERKSLRRMTLTLAGWDEGSKSEILEARPGDHLKVYVSLPRSLFGQWEAIRAEIKDTAAQAGAVLYGSFLLPDEAPAAAAARTAPAKGKAARRPELQIQRFLSNRELPDADKLALVGEELYARAAKASPAPTRAAGDLEFISLRIEGFKSFLEPQRVSFVGGPGCLFLSGRNEVEPKLGANGVGKSSLWDALCWCLWGKTSRGAFGPTLKNWEGSSPCQVKVALTKGGQRYDILRTQSPNTLQVVVNRAEVLTVTQEELSQYLGLSLDEFLLSGLMSQFGKYFVDLRESERLDVFSAALGLDVWEAASESAAAAAKALATEQDVQRQARAKVEGRLEFAKESLTNAAAAVASAEAKLAAVTASADLGKAAEAVEDWRAEAEGFSALGLRYQRDLAAREKQIGAAEAAARAFEEAEVYPAQTVLSRAQAQHSGFLSSRRDLVAAGSCPTCKQEVSEEHVESLRKKADRLVREAAAAESTAKTKLEKAREGHRLLVAKVSALREERQQLLATQANTTKALSEARGKLAVAEKRHRELQDVEINAKSEVSKAEKALEAARASVLVAEEKLSERVAAETALAAKSGGIEFWRKGFRELRFWLVGEALTELTVGSNNALEQLGLVGWSIAFDVERQTQSGNVSRGFHVFVSAPGSPPQTPWEAWSGGESQRLRLAVAVALSDLIGNRTGVRTSVEAWDEPASHLSDEGVADMLSFMFERARAEQKQIWIVDHHKALHGSFDAEYTIVKTAKGSVIEKRAENSGE